MLLSYLNNVDKIDGEAFRILKQSVLKDIINRKSSVGDTLKSFTDDEGITIEVPDYEYGGTTTEHVYGEISFNPTALDDLIQVAKLGLNQNLSLDQIVDKWLNDPETGLLTNLEKTNNREFKALLTKDSSVKNKILKAVV